jgi:hypothetical protein
MRLKMNSNDELNRIVSMAKRAEDDLVERFSENPMLFYTEADLASYYYHIFHQLDEGRSYPDIMGVRHGLVHFEYPTPFRCDMKGHKFSIKDDDDVTENGGKFKRGHYDVVVLNPELIRLLSTRGVHGQFYENVKAEVLPAVRVYGPLIAYALEVQLYRNKISDTGALFFKSTLVQDFDKLAASGLKDDDKNLGFIQEYKAIGFFWNKNNMVYYTRNNKPRSGIRIVPES